MNLLNLILLLLLFHSIIFYIVRPKNNLLACGLFAYIGSPNNHHFSWDKFNHLGLDNDERGGDSIGRVVGEVVTKYVNNKKQKTTYQDYVINHKNEEPSHIAIGHTRKASVGIINEANAQPVVLNLPDNQGRFIMVHNGTLFNHEALADKYGIVKFGKTDSMILAEIIMNNGPEVLKEYDGAAAIIYRDDRFPNTLFVFKGESLGYNNKLSEERPLYFYKDADNSMYISSRTEGLYFIGGDIDSVYDFEPNILYTITEGEIVNNIEIDRKKSSQIKKWEVAAPYKRNSHLANAYEHEGSASYQQRFGFYENAGDEYSVEESAVTEPVYKIYEEPLLKYSDEKQIVFGRLRYWFWRKDPNSNEWSPVPACGAIRLDIFGYKAGISDSSKKIYFFFDGIMMKNKQSYKAICKAFDRNKPFRDDNWANLKTMSKHSMYPVCQIRSNPLSQNATEWNETKNIGEFSDSTIKPLFSYYMYSFNRGDLASRRRLDCKTSDTPINGSVKKDAPVIIPANYIVAPNKSEIALPSTTTKVISTMSVVHRGSEDSSDVSVSTAVEPEVVKKVEKIEKDPIIEKEINEALSTIMMTFDECKSSLEVLGSNAPELVYIIENLTKIEDVLYKTNDLQNKNLILSYDEEF